MMEHCQTYSLSSKIKRKDYYWWGITWLNQHILELNHRVHMTTGLAFFYLRFLFTSNGLFIMFLRRRHSQICFPNKWASDVVQRYMFHTEISAHDDITSSWDVLGFGVFLYYTIERLYLIVVYHCVGRGGGFIIHTTLSLSCLLGE